MIKYEFMKTIDTAISGIRLMESNINFTLNNQDLSLIRKYLNCYAEFKRKMHLLCDAAVVYDIPNLEMAQSTTAYEKNMDAYLDKGQTNLPHDIMLIRTYRTGALQISQDSMSTGIATVYILAMSREKLMEIDGEYTNLPKEVAYAYMCFTTMGTTHYSNMCWNTVFVSDEDPNKLTLAILHPNYLQSYHDVIMRLCESTQLTFDMNTSVEAHVFYLLETLNILRACRNVAIVEQVPKPLTKKQRKQKREDPKPHHIIKVVLPNKKTNAGNVVTTQGNTSIQIDLRAGHFKTFTSERPLFGKHVGTYWWQPIAKDVSKAHYQVSMQRTTTTS